MMSKFKVITFCLLMAFVFAIPAYADMTVDQKTWVSLGNKRMLIAQVDFDSSYAAGGESLDYTKLGFQRVDSVKFNNVNGVNFEYDYTNKKIKAFVNAPPIVYEEKQFAGVSGYFTLDYPAAFIVSVVRSGGTAYPVIYSGTTTLGTNTSCLPNGFQNDVRTAVSTFAVASTGATYYVTYATQAWRDLYKLVVQNELLSNPVGTTAVTRYTTSGNSIWGLQAVKFGGARSGVTPIEWADTPATGEIAVDFDDYWFSQGQSGATQAVCKIATGTQAVYMTYLKQPTKDSWLDKHYVRDENAVAGTSKMNLSKPLLLWLISGYGFSNADASMQIVLQEQPNFFYRAALPGQPQGAVSGVSEMFTYWGYRGLNPDVPAGSGVTNAQVWSLWDSTNMAMTHATYLYGHPWEIPNLQPLEAQNGTDLSHLINIRMEIIGQ